jgi:glycerol-3-phosphate O-acyltransferase
MANGPSGSPGAPLTAPYAPNPALTALYRRFFEHIHVDDSWVASVRAAAARGRVVYVLRNLSYVDFLALDYVTKRFDLPTIRYAQDMRLWGLEPLGKGWKSALLPGPEISQEARIADAFARGGSAVMFVKRAPDLLEQARGSHRAQAEGDAMLASLIAVQRETAQPLLLIPQVFVWSKRPDDREFGVVDALLGSREWPGILRSTLQFLTHYREVDFRAGEPLDLQAFLAENADQPDDLLLRRATYALLRRTERERRGILGPAKKSPDRIRDEVMRSSKLRKVIRDLAGEGKMEQQLLTAKAYGMLRDMEATPEPEMHRAFQIVFEQVVNRIYSGIEVDEQGLEAVREAGKRGTVVFLPSHKSHVDYVMLSHVLREASIQLPVIAAGDNLAFFPMGPLFRRGGAFFIRRKFTGDRLYPAVVDAYLRKLVQEGWAIEFFLEGARSRTGKLLPPKLGLLTMVVDAALSLPHHPVTFIPVSVGYDRVVEERSYVRELTGGEKRKEDATSLMRGTKALEGFYGRVNVQFGAPLTLEDIAESLDLGETPASINDLDDREKKALVRRLGYRVMSEINRVTSVTPGAVVAILLLANGRRGMTFQALVDEARQLVAHLQRRGARILGSLVTSAGSLKPDAIREAAQVFVKAELLTAHVPGEALDDKQRARAAIYTGDDIVYAVPENKRLPLSLSKNTLLHFFIAHSIVATAVRVLGERRGSGARTLVPSSDETARPRERTPSIARALVKERALTLSRLFKFEFAFRADASFDEIFEETVAAMVDEGELETTTDPDHDEREALAAGPGHDALSGNVWLSIHADLLVPFLESYRVVTRTLGALGKGPLSQKEIVKRSLATGERMYLANEIGRREALSKPVFENAVNVLVDQGYVVREGGRLRLSETFDGPEGVAAIEAKISAFLPTASRTAYR